MLLESFFSDLSLYASFLYNTFSLRRDMIFFTQIRFQGKQNEISFSQSAKVCWKYKQRGKERKINTSTVIPSRMSADVGSKL